jgi:hypothetical protein
MTDTKFKKGQKSGPGRPPGTPNKATKALKDMILEALDNKGGVQYLEEQAEKNPTAFLSLIGKVLPTTLVGDPTQPVHFSIGLPWLKSEIQKRNAE